MSPSQPVMLSQSPVNHDARVFQDLLIPSQIELTILPPKSSRLLKIVLTAVLIVLHQSLNSPEIRSQTPVKIDRTSPQTSDQLPWKMSVKKSMTPWKMSITGSTASRMMSNALSTIGHSASMTGMRNSAIAPTRSRNDATRSPILGATFSITGTSFWISVAARSPKNPNNFSMIGSNRSNAGWTLSQIFSKAPNPTLTSSPSASRRSSEFWNMRTKAPTIRPIGPSSGRRRPPNLPNTSSTGPSTLPIFENAPTSGPIATAATVNAPAILRTV